KNCVLCKRRHYCCSHKSARSNDLSCAQDRWSEKEQGHGDGWYAGSFKVQELHSRCNQDFQRFYPGDGDKRARGKHAASDKVFLDWGNSAARVYFKGQGNGDL